MNSEMTDQQVFFVNYDFSFLEAMIDELRETSSTREKTEIITEFASKTNGDNNKRTLLYTYHPL